MPVVTPSTKEQIVRAAERLLAEHGLDGVSLRQIGAAAGNGNNSVVQYHFGSKDQLIQAIFEYRLPRLHERRTLLIAERRPNDLRGWTECQLRTVFEQSELDGSYYMSFLAMLAQHRRRDVFEQLAQQFVQSASAFFAQLDSLLDHIPEPLRSHRIGSAMALIIYAAADRERARAEGRKVLPFAVEVSNLLDGMVGFLEAPLSPQSREAVADAGPSVVGWALFL